MKVLSLNSYRERSIAATLFIDVVSASYFFSSWLKLSEFPSLNTADVGVLVGKTIVLATVLGIVLFSIIGLTSEKEERDERDNAFELIAGNNAYRALFGWIVLIAGAIIQQQFFERVLENKNIHFESFEPSFIAVLCLVALLFASLTKSISLIVLYRRSAV